MAQRVRIFGEIGDYKPGDTFQSRLALSQSGVHRPLQAGISGSQSEGADSIVLSGGYEDDEDHNDWIIYTGHGGRNAQTKKQVTDQNLSDKNLALAKNKLTGLPVRVIRGYNPKTHFSPLNGYRYDGLYRITHFWSKKGRSGFLVWLFKLERIVPEYDEQSVVQEDKARYAKTKRTETTIIRIVRDTALTRKVKEIYDFKCQICGLSIDTIAGKYAEAAHIQPLGEPHNGPDSLDNLLCLCPTHHVMFDCLVFSVNNDFTLVGLEGKLTLSARHIINPAYLEYHRKQYVQK